MKRLRKEESIREYDEYRMIAFIDDPWEWMNRGPRKSQNIEIRRKMRVIAKKNKMSSRFCEKGKNRRNEGMSLDISNKRR